LSSQRRFCVIAPCRDEEAHLEVSLSTLLGQSERPTRLIVVDDGSTDRTPEILERMLRGVPYATVVQSRKGGRRVLGGGVVQAFDVGLTEVDLDEFDYVCKIDLDLRLPPDYFSRVIDLLARDPHLGTVSGKPYFFDARGERHWEVCGDENSVGMTKIYRVAAFRDIGGLVPEVMWDAIDCHEMRRRGWRAASVHGEGLEFEHMRPMGSSDRSILTGRARHGRGQYFMGTTPEFLLASAVRRLLEPPAVSGSVAMVLGYLRAAFARIPRYGDVGFRRDLRRYQREALVRGKREAALRWEERARESVGQMPESA